MEKQALTNGLCSNFVQTEKENYFKTKLEKVARYPTEA